MIVLGLTGSIGMGKTTTTAMFADAGAMVWNADEAVHRLYARGGAAVEQGGVRLAVLDIPLLFETGGDAAVDAVVVVTADPEVQTARVLARPGMTRERFEAIRARQTPDEEKRRRADFIIDTGQGLEAARARVDEIVGTVLAPGWSSPRRGLPKSGERIQ